MSLKKSCTCRETRLRVTEPYSIWSCLICGAVLSFGPANMDGWAIREEIHAEEIAADYMDSPGLTIARMNPADYASWREHSNNESPSSMSVSGWLARQIVKHDIDGDA